jgi:hypothetical protein
LLGADSGDVSKILCKRLFFRSASGQSLPRSLLTSTHPHREHRNRAAVHAVNRVLFFTGELNMPTMKIRTPTPSTAALRCLLGVRKDSDRRYALSQSDSSTHVCLGSGKPRCGVRNSPRPAHLLLRSLLALRPLCPILLANPPCKWLGHPSTAWGTAETCSRTSKCA